MSLIPNWAFLSKLSTMEPQPQPYFPCLDKSRDTGISLCRNSKGGLESSVAREHTKSTGALTFSSFSKCSRRNLSGLSGLATQRSTMHSLSTCWMPCFCTYISHSLRESSSSNWKHDGEAMLRISSMVLLRRSKTSFKRCQGSQIVLLLCFIKYTWAGPGGTGLLSQLLRKVGGRIVSSRLA